jgi:hypothetical protein
LLALFAGSGAFVALSVSLIDKSVWFSVAGSLFFGACALVALVALIPGASHLQLDGDGMTIRSLFREWRLRWADVDHFFATSVSGRAMVCWNYAADAAATPRGARLSLTLTGVEAGLPDTYGLSALDLADLLNRWRARAIGGDDRSAIA